MSIEVFKEKFFNICKENNIDASQALIDCLKYPAQTSHNRSYILTLSEKCLNSDSCCVLSECLKKDNTFEEINFSDCMMSFDCFESIINGLCSNSFITKLNFKGNNIKNNGCQQLAKLLKENQTIIELSLEWNQLGMSNNGFEQFCDSLATNKSLVNLDLRNNQIGTDNTAYLTRAIKKNDVLRLLDLRYNSLGVSGGKEILKIFDQNKTLCKLQLLGNNVPVEIMKQIDRLTDRNAEVQKLNDSIQRPADKSRVRPSQLHHLTTEHSRSSGDQEHLLDRMDKFTDPSARISEKRAISKIIQLEKLLDTKNNKCLQMAARLNLTESKLEVTENNYKGLELNCHKSFQERDNIERQYKLQLDKEKEFRMDMEKRFLKEQSQLQEKIVKLQSQICQLENDLKREKNAVYEFKEKVATDSSEMKLREIENEEKLAKLRESNRKEIAEAMSNKEKSLMKMRQEYEANDEQWREKMNKADQQHQDLSEEINQLKKFLATTNIENQKAIQELRQRHQNDEEMKLSGVKEQLKSVTTMKEDIEAQCSRQSRELEGLHKDLSKYQIQVESIQIKNQNLQEELISKNSQMATEVEKVRLEYIGELNKLKAERQSQTDLFTKIENQNKDLQDLRTQMRNDLSNRDTEIMKLQEKLRNQELEINRMRMEERKKAGVLRNAINEYCTE